MDDSKENASSWPEGFIPPEGTPTGRIKSSDLIDFMERWQQGPTPTYLRTAMAALENSPEIPILTGMDFGKAEARVVAMLVQSTPKGLVYKQILEGEMQGRKADFVIIDDIAPMLGEDLFDQLFGDHDGIPLVSGGRGHGKTDMMLRHYGLHDMPEPEEKMYRKPVKQNGKDASYLDLDPTKKHRRRRR